MTPKISNTFKALIPPLSAEERSGLEAQLLADGCRDALVTWNGVLLDGHNRLEICKKHKLPFETSAVDLEDENSACIWIIQNQFARRNLAPFSRSELSFKLEPLLKKKAKENQVIRKGNQAGSTLNNCANLDTRAELAKAAGVSTRIIDESRLILEHADEETKKQLRENQVSIHRVAKDIKEQIQRDTRAKTRLHAAASKTINSRIIVGDFREVHEKIADGSVSLIFTDPPYDQKASKMLPALADFSASKLADGGSLICYVGQTQLPAALDAFRFRLRYWWTIACVHAGRSTVMREYGIKAGWKAVLWFVKGSRDNNSEFVNDVMSGGEEKAVHDWQQSQSEAAYWIGKLCPKDGLVCDPFIGSGTTAAAAKELGREWIGFEIDPETARLASNRIA